MGPSLPSEGNPAVGFIADMPTLTDHDRRIIARARKLTGLPPSADALREHTGATDFGMAYAVAFGEAAFLLEELAVIAERLGGAR
jgi:hypothetical protein